MAFPFFRAEDDPGSSFPELLRRLGSTPASLSGDFSSVGAVPHATTCVAIRFVDGVVMAGDRRATAGNLISHRSMEKVVEADRHSAVAIAGAAGPAMEMVRLFQLQLEHYEKVEGTALSLEGKANQLSMMVRGNLPAAMSGLVVVPIFGGYDLRRQTGRLWDFDVTGGRYEEKDYVATGSGSLHAGTVIKLGYTGDLDRDGAINLVCRALWEAADADSATGGPDALRGIYPTVAEVTVSGFSRVPDDELAERYDSIAAAVRGTARHDGALHCVPRPRRPSAGVLSSLALARCAMEHCPMTVPFYVAPEQVMKDRADYARKGIARGRAMVAVRYADGVAMVAENSSATLRKISEIYDRIAFAGVGRYNEFDQLRVAGVRAADLKGFQYSRDDVDARSLANQYAQILGQIFTHEMKPMEVEILVAEVGHTPDGDQMFHINYDGTVFDERDYAVLGGDSATISTRFTEAAGDHLGDGFELGDAVRAAVSALAGPERTLSADDLEVALLDPQQGTTMLHSYHRRGDRRLARWRVVGDGKARLSRRRGGRPQQRRRRVVRGLDDR